MCRALTVCLAALAALFAVADEIAEMSQAEAISTILNSRNACGKSKFDRAVALVSREAAAGKPLQQFVIGLTSDDRKLSAKYLDAARERIRALAEKKNNPLAWYLLSMEKNDFSCLKRAADGGNVQALNALGTIATQEAFGRNTISSNALERILRRSYECFHRAAKQRDANALVNLGTCYLRGFGVAQDMALAFECYRVAAEKGHPEGMDNMSACYQFGHGIPKDMEKSLYWRMRARAVRGDEAAQKWLKERK